MPHAPCFATSAAAAAVLTAAAAAPPAAAAALHRKIVKDEHRQYTQQNQNTQYAQLQHHTHTYTHTHTRNTYPSIMLRSTCAIDHCCEAASAAASCALRSRRDGVDPETGGSRCDRVGDMGFMMVPTPLSLPVSFVNS